MTYEVPTSVELDFHGAQPLLICLEQVRILAV
jgi:hypothetical protein